MKSARILSLVAIASALFIAPAAMSQQGPPPKVLPVPAQEGQGGQVEIDLSGKPHLRDLVNGATCLWQTAEQFVRPLPEVPAAIEAIRRVHWYFAENLAYKMAQLNFCVIDRPIGVPMDEFGDVVYYASADLKVVAFRLGQRVWVDSKLFRQLTSVEQAYLAIHETVHDYISHDTPVRQNLVVNFVGALRANQLSPMTPAQLAYQMRMNAVSFEPLSAPFDPIRAAYETLFIREGSSFEQQMAAAAQIQAFFAGRWSAENYHRWVGGYPGIAMLPEDAQERKLRQLIVKLQETATAAVPAGRLAEVHARLAQLGWVDGPLQNLNAVRELALTAFTAGQNEVSEALFAISPLLSRDVAAVVASAFARHDAAALSWLARQRVVIENDSSFITWPIDAACRSGDAGQVEHVLKETLLFPVSSWGGWALRSTLHCAAKLSDTRALALMLAIPGIDVDTQRHLDSYPNDIKENESVRTPLMTAAAAGSIEAVRMLLADPRVNARFKLPCGIHANFFFNDLKSRFTTDYCTAKDLAKTPEIRALLEKAEKSKK